MQHLEPETIFAARRAWCGTIRFGVVRYESFAAPVIKRHCLSLMPNAQLFPGLSLAAALDHWKEAQKAAGISGHTLHDLRHTYAVNGLRKGYKPTVIARQLGHKDASMIDRVYGRFIPDESDYVVAKATAKPSRRTERAHA